MSGQDRRANIGAMRTRGRGSLRDSAAAVPAWLTAANTGHELEIVPADVVLFAQGTPAAHVLYLQSGRVMLSVLSPSGKEAVIGLLGPGEFFGEACLSGQPLRSATASTMAPSVVIRLPKARMLAALRRHAPFGDRFMQHLLARTIRAEEDLVDHRLHPSEQRLARVLLRLPGVVNGDDGQRTVPRLSQETLAGMVGTTRSRINYFMNKFRRLGFIDYRGDITVRRTLARVLRQD